MPKLGMKEIRREEVIEATKRCLARKGSVNLSIKSIAKEAGLSTGIIYHYFENKEELLLKVIKEAFASSHQDVMEAVEPLDSPREKLFRHIDSINSVPTHNPDFYTVLLNYLGQAPANPELQRIIEKFFANLRTYVGRYLGQGVAAGQFDPDKVKDLPVLVIALGMGLGIMWSLDKKSFDIDQLNESCKEMIAKFIE